MSFQVSRFAVTSFLGLVLLLQAYPPYVLASQPQPPDKNNATPAEVNPAFADFAVVDSTGTKNAPGAQVVAPAGTPGGEKYALVPEAGSKNAGPAGMAGLPAGLANIMAGSGQIVTCGAYGNLDWTTTSGTFQVVRQCALQVPANGYVFISADGGMARQDGEYEANFEIGIDSVTGDPSVDRWVNVYNDAGDGTDKGLALSVLAPVTAGAHTFYLLGRRYGGAGTVLVYDPTLSVIFVPATAANAQVCGASGNLNWTTTSSTFQEVRQCSLNVPSEGLAFITTDTSLARQDGEYEALFEIGVDSTAGDANIDRWVNVYNDAGDGSDETMRISALLPLAAGNHTFYSLAKRYAGAGTVLLYDPTLTVIFLPTPNVTLKGCGASGNLSWTTTSSSFQVIRQCTITSTGAGWAFLSADGNVARQDGEYESLFEIDVDSTAGNADTDRWVNVYNDAGDGSDKGLALSVLMPITQGTHTFYLLGRRYSGTGTVLVYDPTLSVIASAPRVLLPLITRQ